MCMCFRNWQSSDCSERTCLFGSAIVDTPKGDLDSSGEIDPPNILVAVNNAVYPYGTEEMFPEMMDSDHHLLSNSAHSYMECSNAGLCNRKTGECECFDGFEGAACQRMTCPGTITSISGTTSQPCNGHGQCLTLEKLAEYDHHSKYKLWSKSSLRGCLCDAGFYGGDCSMRKCKIAVDPMYFDDNSAIQYPFFFFAIMTTATTYDLSDGHAQPGPGRFNLKIYNEYGESFYTKAITVPASCNDLIQALEELPHNLIPKGMTTCFHKIFNEVDAVNKSDPALTVTYNGLYQHYFSGTRINRIDLRPAELNAGYSSSYAIPQINDKRLIGDLYWLQFFGNPYKFGQPEINTYLGDGSRPSLVSPNGVLITKSWTNGQQSLGLDFFNRLCEHIMVRVTSSEGESFLFGTFNINILLRCLGEADDDTANTLEGVGYQYDTGSIYTPHVVRLVRGQQESNEGGQLAVLYYDPNYIGFDTQSGQRSASAVGAFRLLHPLRPLDDSPFNYYDLYVSNGRTQLIQNNSEAIFDFASNHIYTINTTVVEDYDGDISCEAMQKRKHNDSTNPFDSNRYCLDKQDYFFLIDPYNTSHNPDFLNLYQVQSFLTVNPMQVSEVDDFLRDDYQVQGYYFWRRHLLISDLNTNWANGFDAPGRFHVYRFRPNARNTYAYTSECANRGICNTFEGTCECFAGYTGDGCHIQNSIAS
eukprot:gene6643-7343_t